MKLWCEDKRHAQKQVTECDAEDNWRDQTANHQPGIPHGAPACIGYFSTIIKGQRAKEKGAQHQNHRHIKP
ncbi:hypothetical protein SDC9_177618 [bioreactor metagenome]|uniref:Uncharacterized protein n=1 Tax=bioreactor metagenome TaxID=1076179 RepID=A0A645GUZ2_9ZZZZ